MHKVDNTSAITNYPLKKLPFSTMEKWCGVFALITGCIFIIHNLLYYPLIWDAEGYIKMACQIDQAGLMHFSDVVRPYGYPLWLSIFVPLTKFLHIDNRILPLIAQMMGYFLASYYLRYAMTGYSTKTARFIWMGLCCNIFVTGIMSHIGTEALTFLFFPILAAAWLHIALRISHEPAAKVSQLVFMCFVVGCIAGFTIVIRPANLFSMPAFLLGIIALLMIYKKNKTSIPLKNRNVICMIAASAFGLLIPLLPQIANNYRVYQELSPFPHQNFWELNVIDGRALIKEYGFMMPHDAVMVYYFNPLLEDTPKTRPEINSDNYKATVSWYWNNPIKGLATIALHLFNLVDQDMIFNDVSDLHPWWRYPVMIINHVMLGFAALGMLVWVRYSRNTLPRSSPAFAGFIITIVYAVTNLACYSLTTPNIRYGLPVILIASPLAFVGADAFYKTAPRKRAHIACIILIYIIGAFVLSDWVREQSPLISSTG